MNRIQAFGGAVALLLAAALLGGCSGGDGFKTAKVTGQVVCQGQPVGGVAIVFTPVVEGSSTALSGKGANGNADESGRFTLSTYKMGDGAIVGKHRVSVSTEDPDKPLPGKVPPDYVVEVKAGSNDVTIELVP
jgi:hypothetical protein